MIQAVLFESKKIKNMPFEIIDGDRGINYPKENEFFSCGFCLFLSAKNVTKQGFNFKQKQFIDLKKDQSLRKGKLKRDDVVLTTRGTVGNVVLYDSFVPFDNVRINSGMIIIRCDKTKILPKYLYFALKSNLFQNQVTNFSSGSAQPQLPIRDMQNIELPLPNLSLQREVVNHVGTIDEKIELNWRMNKTLEETGEALFRQYFITNPEVDNWDVGSISGLGQVVTGKTPSKTNLDYYGDDVAFLKVPDMHGKIVILSTEDNLSLCGADSQKSKYIPKWSTAISCIATVGVVSLLGKKAQTNQQINSIIPLEKCYRFFNYFMMKDRSDHVRTLASSGSTTPNLNKGQFEKIEVTIPPISYLQNFDQEVTPVFEQIERNVSEIKNLILLRDGLLPKLLSGKIKV